jgi:RNase P subunit RPR2
MPTHRHGTQSFIDFMQTYLQDHPKRCKECGNVARARSEWRIQKRDEDGLHFVHTCPECGTEDDVFLNLSPEHERSRG